MTNPYDGAIGYNLALGDAARIVAGYFDTLVDADDLTMSRGVDIICLIMSLQRTPRPRRRKWRTPSIEEVAA